MRVTGDQKLAVLFSLPVKLIKETILSATQVAVKERVFQHKCVQGIILTSYLK